MIPVVLGTRGSALAQTQAKLMRDALRQAWPQRTFEVHIIRTQGDRLSENEIAPGEKLENGLFTAELERALLENKIHVAVHSLKDLPTDERNGLVIAAVPKRGDARDVLITRGEERLEDLPVGAQVATGSPRRAAQLLLVRPDLEIVDIRGNIDTRLKKFRETPAWGAIVLAAAGLDRLQPSVEGLAVTRLPFNVMLPAPGQGALALQASSSLSYDVIEVLQGVHDAPTYAAVQAERAFLRTLGGGCEEPIAAHAQILDRGMMHLAGVAWLNGEVAPRRGALKGRTEKPEKLGEELAAKLSR